MPHFIQFHRFHNRFKLGAQAFNGFSQILDPGDNRCMGCSRQTLYPAKAHVFKVKLYCLNPFFNRRSTQRGMGIIATALFALVALFLSLDAVFDCLGTLAFRTFHPIILASILNEQRLQF
jgi:hypothetical protein